MDGPVMDGMVASLVEELRAVGVPVSVGEHLDATRAVAHLPLRSRAVLRAALRCTLVKEAGQLATFDLLFDLWAAGGQETGDAPLAGLTDAALHAALRDAIGAGDLFLQPLLADEYVRRFSGVEPGRAVAGVRYMLAATQAADLDGIRDDLLADGSQDNGLLTDGMAGGGEAGGGGAGGAGGPGVQGGSGAPGAPNGQHGAHGDGGGQRASALRDRLTRAAVDRAIDDFRQLLQSAVRRALVADRGAQAVRRTMGVQLAQDMDISGSSAAQSRQIAAAVGPLAQHLARILASQAATRRSRVSIRGTLRRAMGTGGVPFSIVTAPPRPPRPEIVVLCDMSGSVSAFSRFTLDLLTAMDSRLSRLRTFAFIDGLDEITGLVKEARAAGRPLGTMEAAGAASLSGRSDYGRVIRAFARGPARSLTRRSVVLVIGDARTNYLDPAAAHFAEIARRAGRVYWLNPEPRRYWDDGDSVMGCYAPLCTRVEECRTLRQIADFVLSLASESALAAKKPY
jgi:uncharacterized protein with von Willebrand factor type A (vWA) domain